MIPDAWRRECSSGSTGLHVQARAPITIRARQAKAYVVHTDVVREDPASVDVVHCEDAAHQSRHKLVRLWPALVPEVVSEDQRARKLHQEPPCETITAST